jgi:hypothetical protein
MVHWLLSKIDGKKLTIINNLYEIYEFECSSIGQVLDLFFGDYRFEFYKFQVIIDLYGC